MNKTDIYFLKMKLFKNKTKGIKPSTISEFAKEIGVSRQAIYFILNKDYSKSKRKRLSIVEEEIKKFINEK